jgi:hypothetical protein
VPLETPEKGQGLRARLHAARQLRPEGEHFLVAWLQGRDAALVAIEGGASAISVRMRRPPTEGVGCRDCWARGRDAALRVIEG